MGRNLHCLLQSEKYFSTLIDKCVGAWGRTLETRTCPTCCSWCGARQTRLKKERGFGEGKMAAIITSEYHHATPTRAASDSKVLLEGKVGAIWSFSLGLPWVCWEARSFPDLSLLRTRKTWTFSTTSCPSALRVLPGVRVTSVHFCEKRAFSVILLLRLLSVY